MVHIAMTTSVWRTKTLPLAPGFAMRFLFIHQFLLSSRAENAEHELVWLTAEQELQLT